MFPNPQNVDASRSVFNDFSTQITNYQPSHGNSFQDSGINVLPRVTQARFDADNGISICLDGTRSALLREVEDWARDTDPGRPRIFWLSGLAGMGKSTIARTVAENLAATGNLGGSFFFSRDDSQRSSSSKVFTTIAHHLSIHNPNFKASISDALRNDPDSITAAMKTQLEKLIIQPLRRVVVPREPIVIVLDALDECHPPSHAPDIVALLAIQIYEVPFPFKVFITSRPNRHILVRFDQPLKMRILESIVLHDMDLHIVQADIERYILHNFTEIGKVFADDDHWWTEDDLEALTRKSAGLFIFASTAVKFINDEYICNPRQQLSVILGVRAVTSGSPFQDLDSLYRRVLRDAIPDTDTGELSTRFRTIVGAIVLIFDTLAIGPLEALLQVERGFARATIARLHSVIVSPNAQDQPIRIVHPSFADFLTHPGRCNDERFFIDPMKYHRWLAMRCLEHMTSLLRRDICEIKDSSKLNNEIEDLKQRLDVFVPLDLRYACTHWASHLIEANSDDEELLRSLRSFCFKGLLYWLEALSLSGCLDIAIPALTLVQQYLRTDICSLQELLSDAKRFVFEFFEPIRLGALHVYYSALLFAPYDTLLFRTFGHELGTLAKVVVKGRRKRWSSCSRVIDLPKGFPLSVAFSPDGSRIVTALDDGTAHMWDLKTGAYIMAFSGDFIKRANSVVFSPNGATISSGSSDNTVRLWNTTTGVEVAVLKGHSQQVNSVAFSPDGTTVASGSQDCTLCLWDSQTGIRIFQLGQKGPVGSVVYSPNGKQIAWIDTMGVCIWDVTSRKFVTLVTVSHCNERVTARLAYSPCGDKIAIAKHEVLLLDANTGTLLGKWDADANGDTCVAFSPDGRQIALSFYSSVNVYELASHTPTVSFKHHHNVKSIAFSPDGKQIASTTGRELWMWDLINYRDVVGDSVNKGPTIFGLLFSPNGRHLISGHWDLFWLWDLATGSPFAHFEAGIDCTSGDDCGPTVFSPDGTLIASAHSGVIQIFDLSGEVRFTRRACGDFTNSICFSPDGTRIVFVNCFYNKDHYDVNASLDKDDKKDMNTSLDEDDEEDVNASSDEEYVYNPGYDIQLWNYASDERTVLFTGQGNTRIVFVAYSRDGAKIISNIDGEARLWDSISGKCISIIDVGQSSFVAGFSANGSRIVTGDESRQVRIWDSDNISSSSPIWTCSTSFQVDRGPPCSVSFSEDDTYIICELWRDDVHIWPCPGVSISASPYKYVLNGEWVECVSSHHRRRVCWIPAGLRSGTHTTCSTGESGKYFALGNSSEDLTILDLSHFMF